MHLFISSQIAISVCIGVLIAAVESLPATQEKEKKKKKKKRKRKLNLCASISLNVEAKPARDDYY